MTDSSNSPAAAAAAQSQKRPLEDPSSDAGPGEQPDAKRPALERDAATESAKPANGENGAKKDDTSINGAPKSDSTTEAVATTKQINTRQENGAAESTAANVTNPTATAVLETQPIQSTAISNGSGHTAPSTDTKQDESEWLHMRSVITSAEAATIIGKGGENVTKIRQMAGAKLTVSDYSRGAVERILTVSGLVDAIAKAFGLIIRTLNQEQIDSPSTPESKTYALRLLIPHMLVGSIIGHKGVRIREIQEASGARLNASDTVLPNSTERSLIVLGVADAVHIATYYVGSTLVEQLTQRFGGPAASNYATRSGGPVGAVPGGMTVIPYNPLPVGGNWGPPSTFNRHPTQMAAQQRAAQAGYGMQQPGYGAGQQPQVPQQSGYGNYGAAQARSGYAGAGPQPAQGYGQGGMAQAMPQGGAGPSHMGGHNIQGEQLTQVIYIPNDMVGAIIGKGGSKINEIRQLSGSTIKINEPQDGSSERLVHINGNKSQNELALWLLYQRLESEKHRV